MNCDDARNFSVGLWNNVEAIQTLIATWENYLAYDTFGTKIDIYQTPKVIILIFQLSKWFSLNVEISPRLQIKSHLSANHQGVKQLHRSTEDSAKFQS